MLGIHPLRPALWAVSLLTLIGFARGEAPPDRRLDDEPVLDLRQALRTPVRNPNNPDELEYRQQSLAKRVAALQNVGDLAQALLLQEWHVEDQDERVARLNHRMRIRVVEKFEAAARRMLRTGSARGREATARLVGELGVEVRGVGGNWGGATRPLTPDLVRLLKDSDVAVRIAAADALGKINPEADLAVPALARALAADQVAVRRAAAAALGNMVKKASQLSKTQGAAGVLSYRRDLFDALSAAIPMGADRLTGLIGLANLANVTGEGPNVSEVVVTHDELITLLENVVPVAAQGTGDADAEVRRSSLDAIHQVAISFADQIADPRPRFDFPPEGRRPSAEEERTIGEYKFQVEAERQDLLRLGHAIGGQRSPFRRTFTDTDAETRLEARKAMVEIGYVRVKLQRRAASVPPFDKPNFPADQDPILGLYKSVLPELDRGIVDSDVQVRLQTIQALEMLGPDAILALDSLEKALADRDLFVRWSAIRTLGRLPPEKGEKVVHLIIPSLRDPDLDLRMMAAGTLERYGPFARKALPELRESVTVGDADMRRAAIAAILAMGTELARPAIPTLIVALGDDNGPVRRTAAEALARFGPEAQDAVPALTAMQDNDDPEDRRAATNAILKILPAK